LSGTPAANSFAIYPIVFTAANGISPTATQSFTLTVNQQPAFTSINHFFIIENTPGSFTVTASGFPTPTLSELGTDTLPSGVTFDPGTGTLGGTPAVGSGGVYTLHFTAANGAGTNA